MPKRRKTTFQNQLFSHRPNLHTLPSIRTSCCFSHPVGLKAQVGERHTSGIPIPFHTIPYPMPLWLLSHCAIIAMPSCRHRYVILLSSLCYHAAVAIPLHCHRYAIPPPSHMPSYHHRYAILPPSYMKSRRRPYAIPPPLLSHCTAIPIPSCRHNNAMTIYPKSYPPLIL